MAQTKEEYNEYQRVYQLERYHRRRAEAIRILGGRCVVCGTTDDLEIDHINWRDKSFHIGRLWSIAYDRFLDEISKCQLLCEDHHKEKSSHESLDRRPITHGKEWAAIHYQCQCEECIEFKELYLQERNEERRITRAGGQTG